MSGRSGAVAPLRFAARRKVRAVAGSLRLRAARAAPVQNRPHQVDGPDIDEIGSFALSVRKSGPPPSKKITPVPVNEN
jgi:hypothetical protein